MNVFILTDVEGLPGITSIDFMDKEAPIYEQTRRLLTYWINRVAKICLRSGAEKIYYLDGHAGGGTVMDGEVIPSATRVSLSQWQELVKAGDVDCQIELGAHARAGTIGGFLDHTINSKQWFSYKVGGREFSELAMHAAFTGAYGVPVVLCIGDEVACEQAREYVPDIVVAPIKKAEERNVCRQYENAEEIIENALEVALSSYKSIKPMQVSLPAEIELTYYRTDFCEAALKGASVGVQRKNARTLVKTIEKIDSYDVLKF